MRARYALAAAFVVVVLALIFVRDAGYLGGRTEDGPLELSTPNASVSDGKPEASYGFTLDATLDGDPVEMQSVRADFTSPGLAFRAARLAEGEAGCSGCPYPRRRPLVVGRSYDGEGQIVVGLRSKRPGAYYALGLIVDYKRGIRRFRRYLDSELCIAVGREAECADVTRPDAPLAELGGASRYGAPVRDQVARVDRGVVSLTLSNLDNEAIEVSGLTGATVRPDSFMLRRGGGRRVRVDLSEAECGDTIDALRARVDGEAERVPLTVALEVTC